MKMMLLCFSLVLFFGNFAMPVLADEPTTRKVGEDGYINSDCPPQTVVKSLGRCHVECRSDRDCEWGNVCDLIYGESGFRYGRCKPNPSPPTPGGFTGRVERALGEGVPCSIELRHIAEGTHEGWINCNATSGGFVKEGLPVGLYLLRVTAGTAPMQRTRDFYAPVSPGTITYLGALTVPIGSVTMAPSHPGIPGDDLLRQVIPDPEKPFRIPPVKGQPPAK